MTIDTFLDFSTLDALPVFVMVADPAGTVIFFNRAWHEFTGQPRFERDETEQWRSCIHPGDVTSVAEQWRKAVDEGVEVVQLEYRVLQAATNQYRWIKTRASRLRDSSGKTIRWLGVAMDVEEQHRAVAVSSELGRRLQEFYAPTGLPVTNAAYFSGWYEPAHSIGAVGGDWYNAIRLEGDRILFAIGDVVGHGLEAAIMMGRARQSVLTVAANDEPPATILQRSNRVLLLQEFIATCAVGILNCDERTIKLSLAGHCAPVFVDARGDARLVGAPGLPLGVQRESPYPEYTLVPHPGSAIILYTDGLLDFDRDLAGAQRRILETAARFREFNGPDAARHFAKRVLGGAKHDDDIAVLTVAF